MGRPCAWACRRGGGACGLGARAWRAGACISGPCRAGQGPVCLRGGPLAKERLRPGGPSRPVPRPGLVPSVCVRRVGRPGPASRKTAGSVGDLTPVVKISAPPVFARRLRNGLSVPANVIKRRRKSHCRPAFLQPAGPFLPFCRLFGGTARPEGRPCGAFRSRPGRVAGLPPGREGCAVVCRISFLFDKKNVPLQKSKRGVAGRAGCAAVAARRSAASSCPPEGRNKRAPGGARPPARCDRPLAGAFSTILSSPPPLPGRAGLPAAFPRPACGPVLIPAEP